MVDEDDENHVAAHELCEVLEATISAFLSVPGHETLGIDSVLEAVEMTAGVWRRIARDEGFSADRLKVIQDEARKCSVGHYRARLDGEEAEGVFVELTTTGDASSVKLDN